MPAGDQRVVGAIAPEQKPQRASGTRRANPRDLTGKKKQELEAQVAEERDQTAREMAMATAEARRVRTEQVVDYTKGGMSAPGVAEADEVVVADEIEVEDPIVSIRVNAPIEDMVFGRTIEHPGEPDKGIPPVVGPLQFYNFEEGVSYTVPKAMADHLERLGYVYH